jgi:hypothetical protein
MVDREKWSYIMEKAADDKKYARDTRLWGDVLRDDDIVPKFTESHISTHLQIKDICCYAPGDVNLIGKEGKTSWDSFSYSLQMAHNTWMHINAVQEANALYRQGIMPDMLVNDKHDLEFFADIVDDIIRNASNSRADEKILHYNKYWMEIIGQRGYVGKKTVNASTKWNEMIDLETVISEMQAKKSKIVEPVASSNTKWNEMIDLETVISDTQAKKSKIVEPVASSKPQFNVLFEAE